MSLASLWKTQEGEIATKPIQAIVGFAGDGKLRDGSEASQEFREFLTQVPPNLLGQYTKQCLDGEKFPEASSALQDVINEVGRRLGFKVRNGLYRGKVDEFGNDGLWSSEDAFSIILETKTTAVYTIDLETLASYRKKLAVEKKIDLENSSILIVVGRDQTDSLEAQVRGSRHAWDIRIISVGALLRLLELKVQLLEDPQVVQKIRRILRPKEFTKVDGIIDLVFSTARDVKEEEEKPELESVAEGEKKFTPVNFRDACISRIQSQLQTVLIKRSAALFSSADEKTGVTCLNSKKHEFGKQPKYWFAFHPHQKETLAKYAQGFVAFGCGGADLIVFVPAEKFISWLDRFWTTELEDRFYWHVRIVGDKAKLTMDTKAGFQPIDVSQYLMK